MRWNTESHLFRFTGPDESLLAADSRYFEQIIPSIWRLCTWWYYLSILWPRRPRLTWVSGGLRLSGSHHALVRGAGEKPKIKALKMFKWRFILFSLDHVETGAVLFQAGALSSYRNWPILLSKIQGGHVCSIKWCKFKWDPLIVAVNCLVFLW